MNAKIRKYLDYLLPPPIRLRHSPDEFVVNDPVAEHSVAAFPSDVTLY